MRGIEEDLAALHRVKHGIALNSGTDALRILLDAAGVALVPGDAFGDDHYMRISYASSMAELEDGLGRIDTAVQQLA